MVSREQPFPEADNVVKVMRSMDSIQQVGMSCSHSPSGMYLYTDVSFTGLFPPHEGNRRGARERHYGPYDAGTPRALTYHQAHQGHYPRGPHGADRHHHGSRAPRGTIAHHAVAARARGGNAPPGGYTPFANRHRGHIGCEPWMGPYGLPAHMRPNAHYALY